MKKASGVVSSCTVFPVSAQEKAGTDIHERGIERTSDKSGIRSGNDSAQKTAVRPDELKLIADSKKIAASDDAMLTSINTMRENIKQNMRGAKGGAVTQYGLVRTP